MQQAESASVAPGEIPRARSLAGFARVWRFRNHALEIADGLYRRHGPIVIERAGPMTSVHLFGPDANRFVMLDREQNLSAKRSWTMIMGRIFPNGLLLKDGDDHRHHRRIMQGAFRSSALREYNDQMSPRIRKGIADWGESGQLLAFPAFKRLTLELAWSVFLGVDLGPQADRMQRAFAGAVAASMSVVRLRIPGLEFYRGLRGRELTIEYFGTLLAERRASTGNDMLSQLCRAESEDGQRFSDQEIIDHLIFLMMAAHDTTTSTLASMTYELARNPDWQERVREQSLAVGTDELAFDQVDGVPALSLVIMETLRRYPPLSTIPRSSLREFEYQGFAIPANIMVLAYPIHTHHMQEWWTDPYRFDPDRFSEARAEHKRHTHSWVPFSGGPHTCIGQRFAEMQIRAIMHQLVRRYRWTVSPGYEMPVQQAPISKPRDGLPVVFKRL